MRWLIPFMFYLSFLSFVSIESQASDFIVYSVYRGLNLGNESEKQEKDYYINMGSSHGVREGNILQILRKSPTFDLLSEQYYRDVIFPIAWVKVIHSEKFASIARLEKILPENQTPAISPRAIMVGDLVRILPR